MTVPPEKARRAFHLVYVGFTTSVAAALAVRLIVYFAEAGDLLRYVALLGVVAVAVGNAIGLAGLARAWVVAAGNPAATGLLAAAAVLQAGGVAAAVGNAAYLARVDGVPGWFGTWGSIGRLFLPFAAAAVLMLVLRVVAARGDLSGDARRGWKSVAIPGGLAACYLVWVTGVLSPQLGPLADTGLGLGCLVLGFMTLTLLGSVAEGWASPPPAPFGEGPPPPPAPAGKPWLRGRRSG